MPRQRWLGKLAESWFGLYRSTSALFRAPCRPVLRSGVLRVEALEDRLTPSVDLVKDINLQPNPIGSNPSQLVDVSGTVFFVAGDATHGAELWRSDGTPGGTVLVRDIRPGSDGSNLNYLTNVNGTLFFQANDGINGSELWKSDGTAAGTVLVRNIGNGTQGSYPASLTNVTGTLFFHASDPVNGDELWKSDGTANGTVLVRDIRAGNQGSSPSSFTNVNGTLFFQANDGTIGSELWKSDGTAAGTVLVRDIRTGGAYPSFLTNVNGTLFFTALDETNRTELWKSDGTAGGTVLVRNIGSGINGPSPRYLTSVNGTLFFRANDGVNGDELWKSDGTATGTVLVKDIRSGNGGSNPSELTNVNGTLFFRAFGETNGYELWKSDGTAAGTVLVKDISTGSANPSELTNVNGTLFFRADDGVNGEELWKSDGTAAGTVLVKNIRAGFATSDPRYLTNVNGTLFFRAFDDGAGFELWKSDGTLSGTQLVKDIHAATFGSEPSNLTNVDGVLFFSAYDADNGFELWESNGSAAGTRLVKNIRAGAGGSYPSHFVNVNGTLFFQAFDGTHGTELWKSDGTAAGTVLVKDIRPGAFGANPSYLTNVNGTLFFRANNGLNGYELWKSDGTAGGTVLVRDISGGSSYPSYLLNVGGTLFFRASDGETGHELWKSDGTAAGTVRVADILTGYQSSFPINFTNVNGTLFFTAFDPVNGGELWKSDGSANGTVLVRDISTGASTSGPSNLTNVNGTLYFTANDGNNGSELWKSNGTAGGTVLVKDIQTGFGGSLPSNLTNVNGTLFFTAFDDSNRTELWKSDGTAAGTVLVKNIRPGTQGSYPSNLTNLAGTLFFRANDGVNGYEVWKSDGTAAGTVLVSSLAPGSGDGDPQGLVAVGGTLFFTAVDETHGRELWRVDAIGTNYTTLDGAGNLTINDIAGNRDNELTVRVSGSNLVISDPNATFSGSVGALSDEGHTLSVPLSSVTGLLTLSAGGGSDTLTIDFSGGNPVPAGGIRFDGGDLVLQGNTHGLFSTITHTLTADGGSIRLADDDTASTIVYTGPANVSDDLDATHRVFNFTGAAENITLGDDGAARMRLSSSLSGSVDFAAPSRSLMINTANGDDTVTIASVNADYRAALTLNTDSGDTVRVNANLNLGSPGSAGNFTIADARQVYLNGSIFTESGGSIAITGAVDLGTDVVLDTGSVFGDGNITLSGPVNSESAAISRSLQLFAGGGAVSLGSVGISRALQSLTVTAGTTTLAGGLRTSTGPIMLASRVALGAASVLLDVGGTLAITGSTLDLGSNTLIVNSRGASTGVISSQITGAGATLQKNGPGLLLLTGDNRWSGNTTVNSGILRVSNSTGSGTGTSNITVNSTATLDGTGTISGTVRLNDAARLASGTAVGTLVTGGVIWGSNTFFDATLDGGPSPPRVSGGVTLGGTLRLSGNLIPNPAVLQQFVLIENDGTGPVTGTFKDLPEGSEITLGGSKFYISYVGGSDRNDVVLSSLPVINGTDGADTLILRGNGTMFEASLNGGPALRLTPSAAAALHFFGGAGDDLLLIQYDSTFSGPFSFASTDPIPTGGIYFDGESQDFISRRPNGPGDIVRVQDLRATHTLNATYTPSASVPGAGTVTIAGSSGGTVTFTGVEPLDISGMATATVAMPDNGGDDTLTMSNGFDSATGLTPALVVSGTMSGAAYLFNNDLVVLDTTVGDGNDTIVLQSASNAHGNARLRIDTGVGADTVTVSGAATFNGDIVPSTADVEIDSQNIAVNAAITVRSSFGLVDLNAHSGAITTNWPDVDVIASDLIANADGGIDLDTAVSSVTATVAGNSDLRINEIDGLSELNLTAAAGVITVTTGGGVYSSDTAIDVVGDHVRFNVLAGDFGATDTVPGHAIQTSVGEITVDTSGRNGSQFIRESDDLTALNLNAGSGNVALFVTTSLADADAETDVVAGSLFLVTRNGVGSGTPAELANPLQTEVAELDASNTTSGGIYLANRGALTIRDSSLDPDRLGLMSLGGGLIEAFGPLTIRDSVLINDSMTLSAGVNNLTIQTGVTILLNKGSAMTVTLEAGNIDFQGDAGIVTGDGAGRYLVNLLSGAAGNQALVPLRSDSLISQHAADVQPGGAAAVLTAAELAPIVAEALSRLAAAGVPAEQLALLAEVPFLIADLNGQGLLGQTERTVSQVVLDDDGAGHGWFVDPTPTTDTEFAQLLATTERLATSGPAVGQYDLLTVVMHEMMAVLGHPVKSDAQAPHDLMAATLATGTRRQPVLPPPVVAAVIQTIEVPPPPPPAPPPPPPVFPQPRKRKRKPTRRVPPRPKRPLVRRKGSKRNKP